MTAPDDDALRQGWRDFFARGERFDVRYDADRWHAIMRHAATTATVYVVLAVAVLGLVVWRGRFATSVLGSILALGLVVFALVALHKRADLRRQSGGEPGLALGVSAEGVHTPIVGTVPWSDVLAVFFIDEHVRVGQARRQKGLKGIAARQAEKNGAGAVFCNLVMPDGKGLRQRIPTRGRRRVVQTWAHHGAPDFGVISFTLDTALSSKDVATIGLAMSVAVRDRGIVFDVSPGAANFIEHMGRISNVFDDEPPAEG